MEKQYTISSNFIWVLKVLDSCTNHSQIESCEELFEIFITNYKDYLISYDRTLSYEKTLRDEFQYYKNKKYDSLVVKEEYLF